MSSGAGLRGSPSRQAANLGRDCEVDDSPLIGQFFPGYLTPPQDYIGFFVGSSLIEYVYNFPIGSFSALGTYSTFAFGNPGTLTVTVTSEPSTLLCCLVALLSIVAVARTRDAQGESPF